MALIDVIDIEVVVKCAKCGIDLSTNESRTKYGDPQIDVYPCEDCIEKSYEDGYSEAKNQEE